jgi:hypothetical protein
MRCGPGFSLLQACAMKFYHDGNIITASPTGTCGTGLIRARFLSRIIKFDFPLEGRT